MGARLNRISPIIGLSLGIIYLASSFLKSISANSFAEQVNMYGVFFPQYLAPTIIVVEALVGIGLIFGIWQRQMGCISAIVIIIFTIVYTYGLVYLNISNCGCFGDIQFLNSSPGWLYLRNAMILVMSGYIFIYPASDSTTHKNISLAFIAMVIGGSVIAYTSGLSLCKFHKNEKVGPQKPIAVTQSPIGNLLSTHPDSTYLIFYFSYSCPYCLNSIANLNEYENAGVVDKVIGITRGNINDEKAFQQWFRPKFQIINLPQGGKMVAKDLPTSYFIKNDSVILTYHGEIPCAFLFSKIINSQENLFTTQ